MVSLRFLVEDNQVSVPEFLEYLSTPTAMRQARAATSAVRLSLAFLRLEHTAAFAPTNANDDLDDAVPVRV